MAIHEDDKFEDCLNTKVEWDSKELAILQQFLEPFINPTVLMECNTVPKYQLCLYWAMPAIEKQLTSAQNRTATFLI
ncbi:hypothetical protein PGTUg99_028270 [Puccinia graminis f. sp. tritici]|uniref:Uncharacterized protein n=1 Tax=Puccinia graminis f. sp. tritici TaxID=56615 RepID=A0A5B0R5Y4_PUCGR|nr:hypothetical protein PGTUg99_028270 [Puccinia graminis f. sp. tritici]